ncbi:hypothetical protein D3H65_09555 [Paraflavitalea soli]|uniref:Uncharacterized protein n=1 Tax=Paraflavitalea soli TaxID=2315862 RepID=A0A3B7MLM8_9BACT|nr:hypothetical protein [Paraflavitalea soli]AXY74203.1 hypothetical protein D3H65_09555 [Paraflavitalea soli]
MGVFHYPRINVNGLLQINVGTANNGDYFNLVFGPDSPYAPGKPVMLADSVNVQPYTYGMSDADWTKWAITPLQVANPPQQKQQTMLSKGEGVRATRANENPVVIPGEWNVYGDMGLTMIDVKVTGITDPGGLLPPTLKTSLQQSILSFNNRPGGNVPNPAPGAGRTTGVITDVNPEDVNSSQIFADFLSLETDGAFLFSGKPTKSIIRWVNFQRNTNLKGSNGAAATFQMCVPLSELQGQPILQGLPPTSPEGAKLKGIVFRYTLYRGLQEINVYKYDPAAWITQMAALYAKQGLNPDYCQLQGTIAPWFEGEPESCPVGRFLIPPATGGTIPMPPNANGNGPVFNLAPAIVYVNPQTSTVSVDFSATFPEQYTGNYDPKKTDNNYKWDFGPISLMLQDANGNAPYIKPIPYIYAPNDRQGWIFDFPIDLSNSDIQKCLQEGSFAVFDDASQTYLQETPYFIVSDQSGVFAEQDASHTPNNKFRNDGPDLVTTSFLVYKRGKLLTAADPERFTLYFYDTTPAPSENVLNPSPLMTNYQSGQPISIPVGTPGNRLITATLSTDPPPPTSYNDFQHATSPIINIRILPTINYEKYYQPQQNPGDPRVGNSLLTFDVIYNEVLRNYYLLYPAMSQRIPLNDPEEWKDAEMAGRLMKRISLENWGTAMTMPRTRDLSQSRRELLTAWCLTFFQ